MCSFKKRLLLSGAILTSSVFSSYVHAVAFGLEARSLGMGNVSVVTADIGTAALANPAMLSFQPAKEDFSLMASGGFLVDDSDGMVDLIDAFQSANNAFQNGPLPVDVPTTNIQVNNVNNMTAAAVNMNNKTISPSGVFAAVVGFSGESYSFAFSARGDITAAGGLSGTVPNNVIPTISSWDGGTTATNVGIQANSVSLTDLTVEGIQTVELGVSLAKNFKVGNNKVAIGLTPKVVMVEHTASSNSIASVDTGYSGLRDGAVTTDLGDVTSLDAGIVVELSQSTQIGLVIKNLVENEITFGTSKVSFSRQARAGIAYRGDLFTIGIDMDLIETDPIVSSAIFQNTRTKMFSVGAEFNAWDFMQLRLGMQQNMASGLSPSAEDQLLTAGVGLWLGFNLDAAVVASENVLGGMVNAGFKF